MPQHPRRMLIAQTAALLAVLTVVVPAEVEHWREAQQPGANWFFGIYETTLPLVLMLVLPYFWCVRRPICEPGGTWWARLTAWWRADATEPSPRTNAVVAVLMATVSLALSAKVAQHSIRWEDIPLLADQHRRGTMSFERPEYRFGDLPPAYHDEFSYLFQAKTYLAGRLSFDSHPTAARLFDQMHVVNEGRFASRYFPATGLFVAPWLWLGWPLLGHWLATAATCVMVFGIGRELSNNGTGLIAGLLTALSPGLALFSNLVLAHQPTLVGLFCFAWSFLRWLRTNRIRDVALAGAGLSWAMLCRPMTAAGFGLPFGVVFVCCLWKLARIASEGERSVESRLPRPRWRFGLILGCIGRPLLAMALPLAAGFLVLAIHNRAITGSVTTSPYQLFTDTYTPRHVFGFNNVVRGERRLGPRVLEQYDRWAENLTPALAWENTKTRLISSWQWTVGLVPLLAGSVVVALTGADRSRRWWLIVAAIGSLFAVHVPYWFVGMFGWHYVFETGPLWCLLLAAATDTLCRGWLAAERPRMPLWWSLLIASALAVNLTELPPLWAPSKLDSVVEQAAFSRLKYQAFEELLQRQVRERPALVLIEADAADRHIDFVVNDPSLSADVLRGRYLVADWPLERIAAEFPDRALYVFRATTGELQKIRSATKPNLKAVSED